MSEVPPSPEAEVPERHPMPKTYRQLLRMSVEELRDLLRILVDRTMQGKEGRSCDKMYDHFGKIFPAAVQVAGASPKSVSSQLLIAELAVVFKFLSTQISLYNASLGSPLSTVDKIAGRLPFLRLERHIELDPTLFGRIESLAEEHGGSWLAFCRTEAVSAMAAADPVRLIGEMDDLRQIADEVRLNVKLDDQQLKLLRAFFRDA